MTSLISSSTNMPLTGFGLWKVPKEEANATVYDALKAGYRLLDGASDYGNEKECGDGLTRAIKDGIVTREEVFVTSKLWNTNHAKEHVLPIVKKQLADWGVDYFDLFLIHFPVSLEYVDPAVRYPSEWWDGTPGGKVTPSKVPVAETWRAMEEVKSLGLAKEIGVSNFCGALLIDLIRSSTIKPAVLQIEHHPYLTQVGLVNLCKELDIKITAYSSFGPQSFLELDHPGALKTTSLLHGHSVIDGIAKARGKTAAQVLLRWSTQRGIAVIPKSNDESRRAQNLNHTDFDLSKAELDAISALNIGLRFNNPADIDPRLGFFA